MTQLQRDQLASRLHELTAVVLNTEDLELALHHVAVTARRSVPGRPHCGVTLTRPPASASTGTLAAAADAAQHRRGTGPCLEAIRTGEVIMSNNLASENRWGGYPARAMAQGVHSVLALPMGGRGALNLYFGRAGAFDDEATRLAELIAAHAALLVGLLLRRAHEEKLVEQLREALDSRTIIGQAIGIVMARERCGAESAFTILRAVSQHRNVKLRQVAEEMVTDVSGEPPLSARFEVTEP